MKKQIVALTLTGLLLGLGGCARTAQTGAAGDYKVYFSALEDRYAAMAVGYETWERTGDTQPVSGLLRALFQGPTAQNLTSPFPDGVRLLSWELLDEGCLHLDLSEQYGSLTGIELTVADACLTLTLCQVGGVESVYVTVEGSEIPYRPIQQLKEENLLLSMDQRGPEPETSAASAG